MFPVRAVRILAAAIDGQTVIANLEPSLIRNRALPLLDGFIHELLHPAADYADDVIVMLAAV